MPLTSNMFTVQSTFEFCNEINDLTCTTPMTMASFDVESLFTNVPLLETIDNVINLLFKDCSLVHNMNKKQFHELLVLSCTGNIFLFNGTLYLQKEGCAMGGCLFPLLANIFMCHPEEKWLSSCPPAFKPFFYRRYVDDTFLLFKNPSHIPLFKEYLNTQHPNINSTSESEVDNQLPFIGVKVMHQDLGFTTCVYRKPTDTGLGMNYLSFVSSTFKPNSILTLLHRCYSICSNWSLFNIEVQFLHKFYTTNRFPSTVFWRTVRKFRNRISNPPAKSYNVPKEKQFLSLPFFGHSSYVVRNKLCTLFRNHFPQMDIKIVLSNKQTIGSLFPVKEQLCKSLCSNVIYLYKCQSETCEASYVGSTIRTLHDRVSEHKGISNRTERPLSDPKASSIRDHSISCKHPIENDSFRIIGRCREGKDLRLLESIFIKHLQPSLNNAESAVPLCIA